MEKENLQIEEYKAAQQFVIHYERLIWYIGSILNASVVVLAGMVIEKSRYKNFGLVVFISFVFSAVWYLFERRYRQINLQKLKRMHELEKELGFKQSLYVLAHDKEHKTVFRAHILITIICVTIPFALLLFWIMLLIG